MVGNEMRLKCWKEHRQASELKRINTKMEHLSLPGVCNHSMTFLLAARNWYSENEVRQLSHSPLIQFLQTHILKCENEASSLQKLLENHQIFYLLYCQIFFTTGSCMTATTDYWEQRKGSLLHWRRNPWKALPVAVFTGPTSRVSLSPQIFKLCNTTVRKGHVWGLFFVLKPASRQ